LTVFRKKACVKLSGDDGDVPGGTSHVQSGADDLSMPQGVDPTTVPAAATSSTFRDARHKALQLQFTLPPGTYATMLLRELTKESTESCFQAQLSKDASSSVDATVDALDMDDC